MIQDKGIRVYQVFKNVQMDILGEIRTIAEVRVSFTNDGKLCLSFDEYNRIMWSIHQELKRKRRVYHEND